jgi:hypothetical protein
MVKDNNLLKYVFIIWSVISITFIFYNFSSYFMRKPLNSFIAANNNCSYCTDYKGVHSHSLTIKDMEFYYNDASSGVECSICKNNPLLNHIHMV